MEILKEFGINPILLVAQIINFLIILYILKRFLHKPILQTLKNREDTIQRGLKNAEEAKKALDEALEKEKKILSNAQKQTKILLDEARKERGELLHKAEAAARKSAESILQEARSQIIFESREAEKRLAAHVSELAINFLQKSISELFSENEQDLIISSALKKIKSKRN